MPIQDINLTTELFGGVSLSVQFDDSSEIVLNITRMEFSVHGNVSAEDFRHYMMFMFLVGNSVEETVTVIENCEEFVDSSSPELVSRVLTESIEVE